MSNYLTDEEKAQRSWTIEDYRARYHSDGADGVIGLTFDDARCLLAELADKAEVITRLINEGHDINTKLAEAERALLEALPCVLGMHVEQVVRAALARIKEEKP